MFDRELEERIEKLEAITVKLLKEVESIFTIIDIKRKQMKLFTHFINGLIAITTTLLEKVDMKKYDKEYQLYKFHMNEAKGMLRDMSWEAGEDSFNLFK